LANLGLGSSLSPVASLPSPPPEPNVYEDYFPLGAISAELCRLHGTHPAPEPLSVVRASYPPRPIVIERVLRSDGTTGIGIKGGGH
jgi:hypothetical protein